VFFFSAGMLIIIIISSSSIIITIIINNAARPLESKHSHRHTSDLFPKAYPWFYCDDHILFSSLFTAVWSHLNLLTLLIMIVAII